MKIDVLTLFPAMFTGPLDVSIVQRARSAGLLDLAIHNLRDWTHDRHKTVDDKPFGGGPGMVLKPEPLFEAIESLAREKTCVILMAPDGERFDQQTARELSGLEHLLIVCGSYEGIDERVRQQSDRSRAVHWRLCADERRVASHGAGGCGYPAVAGSARR